MWPWYAAAGAAIAAAVAGAVILLHPSTTPAAGPSPSPSATATVDAAAVEACREAKDANDTIDKVTPAELLSIGNVAARATDPAIQAAGLKLQGAAQTAVEQTEDFPSRMNAITAVIELETACIDGRYNTGI